jgi:hypothetical protein
MGVKIHQGHYVGIMGPSLETEGLFCLLNVNMATSLGQDSEGRCFQPKGNEFLVILQQKSMPVL